MKDQTSAPRRVAQRRGQLSALRRGQLSAQLREELWRARRSTPLRARRSPPRRGLCAQGRGELGAQRANCYDGRTGSNEQKYKSESSCCYMNKKKYA